MSLISRLSRRTLAVLVTAVAATTSVVAASAHAAAGTTNSPVFKHGQPTVVLVHGADADSSSWHGVIVRLQERGYPVIAFDNPLRGVATDAANLRALIDSIKGPIVLVGHSYGGMVISVAAAGDSHVKSLVFVDAQIPLPGETAAQLTNKYPGSQFGADLIQRPFVQPDGAIATDLYVDPTKYRELFTGPGISARQALAFAAVQRPVAESALNEPARAAAWRTIPSWDVIGLHDAAIPPASQLFMAHRAHAHITRIPAWHASMLSFAGPIAKVIEAAAR